MESFGVKTLDRKSFARAERLESSAVPSWKAAFSALVKEKSGCRDYEDGNDDEDDDDDDDDGDDDDDDGDGDYEEKRRKRKGKHAKKPTRSKCVSPASTRTSPKPKLAPRPSVASPGTPPSSPPINSPVGNTPNIPSAPRVPSAPLPNSLPPAASASILRPVQISPAPVVLSPASPTDSAPLISPQPPLSHSSPSAAISQSQIPQFSAQAGLISPSRPGAVDISTSFLTFPSPAKMSIGKETASAATPASLQPTNRTIPLNDHHLTRPARDGLISFGVIVALLILAMMSWILYRHRKEKNHKKLNVLETVDRNDDRVAFAMTSDTLEPAKTSDEVTMPSSAPKALLPHHPLAWRVVGQDPFADSDDETSPSPTSSKFTRSPINKPIDGSPDPIDDTGIWRAARTDGGNLSREQDHQFRPSPDMPQRRSEEG